jgi:hypothetical protein
MRNATARGEAIAASVAGGVVDHEAEDFDRGHGAAGFVQYAENGLF